MKLVHVYEKLLTVYPKSYRLEYADEMSQTLADMLDDEQQLVKRVGIWLRAFAELPISLFMANLQVIDQVYSSQTPAYVTRTTQTSAALLTPFMVLVIYNQLRPDRLPNSPNAVDILQFLAIGLPGIAFLLTAATFLLWFYSRQKSGKASFVQSLTDIKHNWPLAAVGTLAFAILIFMVGHDSAHCLSGNPIREARNFTTTMNCISRR